MMDDKEWRAFEKQALKLMEHKKKCDYDEPGIWSIIAAYEELKERREAGQGADRIAAERVRQKSVEGWTPEHDEQHCLGELPLVAACYALEGVTDELDNVWPATWGQEWDKRKKHDRVRRLEIAGALIAAELDRINVAKEKC